MHMSLLTRFCIAVVCLLGGLLWLPGEVRAERAIVQVTPGEYRRLGYQDKDEFTALYAQCIQVANTLKKNNVCADDECVKKSQEWQNGNCDKHAATVHYLTMMDPPRYPVSEMFDNAERANYVRLYTASCQDGFKAMNPGTDVALVKNTCECAAGQSLDLIEYSDYKAFESTNASKEVIERVKNRAAYARFICENKPAVWREQSAGIGSDAGTRKSVDALASVGKANTGDAGTLAILEQLKSQGISLYNNLLAKLNVEASKQSCQGDALCNRVNETLGAIYKDVLYVAYAAQIYQATDQSTRALARTRLDEFVKAALNSIEPNFTFLRNYAGEQKGHAGDPLLAKAFRDAEACQKLMLALRRELGKR